MANWIKTGTDTVDADEIPKPALATKACHTFASVILSFPMFPSFFMHIVIYYFMLLDVG